MKNEEKVVDRLKGLRGLHISAVTLAELFYGIYNSKNRDKHKKALIDFLTDVAVLDTNFPIANKFGKIKSELKNKGTIVGDFDILNGAFALTYGFTLITRNVKHYKDIDGLKIETI